MIPMHSRTLLHSQLDRLRLWGSLERVEVTRIIFNIRRSSILVDILFVDMSTHTKTFHVEPVFVFPAPRINPSMFDLKWNEWSADQVWNRYRGLTDFGKLQSVWLDTNELVRFQDMRHPNDLFKFKLENESSPGKTVFVRDRRDLFMCIKCREGWVSFKNFYYGKRKVMSTRDFYNGFFSKYKKTSKSLYFGSQSPDKNKET